MSNTRSGLHRQIDLFRQDFNEHLRSDVENFTEIKTDLRYMKEKIDSSDKKQWYIIGGIALLVLTTVLTKLLG